MDRKYKKGTKLQFVGVSKVYTDNRFTKGEIYTVGYAKPWGRYCFDELTWDDFSSRYVENPENFKLGGISKWKKFINTGKVI